MLDSLFVTPVTVLTKTNEIYICVVNFMIPLAYVLQSTMNRVCELIECRRICNAFPSLLQELQDRDRVPDSWLMRIRERLLSSHRLLSLVVTSQHLYSIECADAITNPHYFVQQFQLLPFEF